MLVKSAMETANWDSARAIADLFEIMGEPEAEQMPGPALELSRACIHQSLTGARIGAAWGDENKHKMIKKGHKNVPAFNPLRPLRLCGVK